MSVIRLRAENPPDAVCDVADALGDARDSLTQPTYVPQTILGRLARHVLAGATDSSALAEWFADTGDSAFAPSVSHLPDLLAAPPSHIPRALELHDLLSAVAGKQPRASHQPVCVTVVVDRGSGGATLRLMAYRTSGAPGFAADAFVHGFAVRDGGYRRAEQAVHEILTRRTPDAAVRYALLTPEGAPYERPIRDGSFGAALALAATCCARPRRLTALSASNALTGIINSDESIGPVDPLGLQAKVVAARCSGARNLLVPTGQSGLLPPQPGIGVREIRDLEAARRAASRVRTRVFAAALVALLLTASSGVAAQIRHDADQRRAERHLAVGRATLRATDLVDSTPRTAVSLVAAAAMLEPSEFVGARDMLAARLPYGLRYLPDPPEPIESVVWTGAGISAATARSWLRYAGAQRGWAVRGRLPSHSEAAFIKDGRLLLRLRRGAMLLTSPIQEGVRVSARSITAITGGRHNALMLDTRGQLTGIDSSGTPQTIPTPTPMRAIALNDNDAVIAVSRNGSLYRSVRGKLRRASGRALGGAENSPLPRSPIDLVAGRGPQVVALGEDGHITERGPGGEFNGVEQGDGRALLALGDGFSAVARSDGVELQFGSAFTGVNRGTRLAGDFTALATSPDSRRLVTAGREVATLSLESTLRTETIGTGTIAFGARNDVLAFGGNFADQSRLRPGRDAVEVTPIQPYSPGQVRVSANRRWAARLRRLGQLDIWDLRRGTHSLVTPHDAQGKIAPTYYNVGVLDNGDVAMGLATDNLSRSGAPAFGQTLIINSRTGAARDRRYEGSAQSTQATSGGQLLLARGEFLDVVRVRDMTRVARAHLADERIIATTSTPDGTIFLGSSGGTIWRWYGRSGAAPTRIGKLGSAVLTLAARPDARLVFAGTLSGRTLIDVEQRRAVALVLPETYRTLSGAFSADGSNLAISDSFQAAHLVSVKLDAQHACAMANRHLSESVWRNAVGTLPVEAPQCG